jgi:hypothetical protein
VLIVAKKMKPKYPSNLTPTPHPNNLSGFPDEVMVFLAINFRKTYYP